MSAKRVIKEFEEREIDQEQLLKDEIYKLKEKLARSERARNEAWQASEKEKIACERQMYDLRKIKAQLQDQVDGMTAQFSDMEHQIIALTSRESN